MRVITYYTFRSIYSLEFLYGCHKVSAIYLCPPHQWGRTSCSLTTIWSNTTYLTSLLQKTWWQWRFLCFNKDQSKKFIESPDFLSSPWAPWSSSSLIDSPVDLLPFMDKKAFISGLPSSLCCFLNSFIAGLASYLHLTCHTWRSSLFSLEQSFAYFPPYFCFFYFVKWMQKFFYELLIFDIWHIFLPFH